MTTKQINDQIRIIRIATEKASRSKETAVAFLLEAGILQDSTPSAEALKFKKK